MFPPMMLDHLHSCSSILVGKYLHDHARLQVSGHALVQVQIMGFDPSSRPHQGRREGKNFFLQGMPNLLP